MSTSRILRKTILSFVLIYISATFLDAQEFYFGADQSYVNEMEDCGVSYTEDGSIKDVYKIFKDHGNNLVRLRLWHTPAWYDELNQGKRYSDLADVKKAIKRAKDQEMRVLLDFHLSDNWADPSKQLVPSAWLPIVNNTETLKDSLYNYIYKTLSDLNKENLLPELVQIGNETNKGILLSPEDNNTWTLDWERNSTLFNAGIAAVRDLSDELETDIKIMLHIADPSNAGWMAAQMHENGISDFDIIGLSYYWAWHKPVSIEDTKNVIEELRNLYNKEVLIVETGYIWTTESNDNAGNIISEVHPDYSPASPINQRDWLIELTKNVIAAGGIGVCYWEPSWVSSPCWNQWNQGSHQEHATYFDFNNNLLIPGGIEWMEYDYGLSSTSLSEPDTSSVILQFNNGTNTLNISIKDFDNSAKYKLMIYDSAGRKIKANQVSTSQEIRDLSSLTSGTYIAQILKNNRLTQDLKFSIQ